MIKQMFGAAAVIACVSLAAWWLTYHRVAEVGGGLPGVQEVGVVHPLPKSESPQRSPGSPARRLQRLVIPHDPEHPGAAANGGPP